MRYMLKLLTLFEIVQVVWINSYAGKSARPRGTCLIDQRETRAGWGYWVRRALKKSNNNAEHSFSNTPPVHAIR